MMESEDILRITKSWYKNEYSDSDWTGDNHPIRVNPETVICLQSVSFVPLRFGCWYASGVIGTKFNPHGLRFGHNRLSVVNTPNGQGFDSPFPTAQKIGEIFPEVFIHKRVYNRVITTAAQRQAL